MFGWEEECGGISSVEFNVSKLRTNLFSYNVHFNVRYQGEKAFKKGETSSYAYRIYKLLNHQFILLPTIVLVTLDVAYSPGVAISLLSVL